MPLVSQLLDGSFLQPAELRVPSRGLITPEDVGGFGAWQVLVREGALIVVFGTAACVAGTLETPGLRARALKPHTPARTVVAGRSAAWVHCGGEAPRPLELAHRIGTNRPRCAEAVIWSASGLPGDTMEVAGLSVTTPLRTAVDVVIREAPEVAIPTLRLLFDAGVSHRAAAQRLEWRSRVPTRTRARHCLAAAAGC